MAAESCVSADEEEIGIAGACAPTIAVLTPLSFRFRGEQLTQSRCAGDTRYHLDTSCMLDCAWTRSWHRARRCGLSWFSVFTGAIVMERDDAWPSENRKEVDVFPGLKGTKA